MDLEPEWPLNQEDYSYREEGQREDKDYLLNLLIMFTDKIKKSREFSSVFKTGRYLRLSSLIIQYKKNSIDDSNNTVRYGIVVSKKVGNAVQRNFTKRRLRAVLNNINSAFEKKSMDYVFVARKSLIKIKCSALYIELYDALKKINQLEK